MFKWAMCVRNSTFSEVLETQKTIYILISLNLFLFHPSSQTYASLPFLPRDTGG